jgi:hypothetical protein
MKTKEKKRKRKKKSIKKMKVMNKIDCSSSENSKDF